MWVLLNSNLSTIESNDTFHNIKSSTSILDLFKTQKFNITNQYSASDYSLFTDYPTSLISAEATLYPVITIKKYIQLVI